MASDFWLGGLGDHVTPNLKDAVDPAADWNSFRWAQYKNRPSSDDEAMVIEEAEDAISVDIHV